MQTEPSLTSSFQIDDDNDVPPFNVIIAYEDVVAGRRAMQLYTRLRQEHATVDFHARLWSFDLLADKGGSQVAIADTRDADLFIISAGNGPELPISVRNWLIACLDRKPATPRAMVALLDGLDRWESPNMAFLQNLARNAGLDFFAPVPPSEPLPVRGRSTPRGSILQPTVPRPHWGINE